MMVMNWDGLGDDDDQFFESLDRISSAISLEMASSGSDDDEDFEDSRISFASAISTPSDEFRSFTPMEAATSSEDYNLWMSEPGSIKERRRRLLQGMGLGGDKELLRLTSAEFMRVASKKAGSCKSSPLVVASTSSPSEKELQQTEHSHLSSPSPLCPTVIVRSRSDGNIASALSIAKRRKEQFLGVSLNHHLIRSSSGSSSSTRYRNLQLRTSSVKLSLKKIINGSSNNANGSIVPSLLPNSKGGAFVLIKNLDTGKEFIVNEFDEDGMWNKLSDLQTGKQLTRDEFEKCVGYSPIVKELMRRENVSGVFDDSVGGSERKISMNPSLARSLRFSKRMGVAWLKNIRGVANSVTGFIGDKEKEHNSLMEQQSTKSSSEWMKVRQHGKSYKELTGLYMSQEIQAHQGSIWTIRFSCDAHYLASAGEDRVIHVWEVLDSDVLSLRLPDETNFTTSVHPMAANNSPDRPLLEDAQVRPSERKRRGKVSSTSKKGCSIPDHVIMPETVFSLSEKPVCSFQGHLDDVLDLSWSKNQQLLSSSMDKTVRLWDMESKTCLKLFAHNDYVTCIQFNPIDDRYFISGSLDAKVRLWSIPDRQVVDWTELHEMVTAACYTPDGQGALVGSHKGSCRIYNTSECKLSQKGQIDIQNKRKSQAKKITGFQFAPGNSYEVLITSADSRIRIFDGSDVTHKFQGFRNTSSQISASFTADGKYVVCASEDSQIYIWKRDEIRNVGGGKGKGLITTRSYEQFQCRDVSVAIPWPGSIKYEPPTLPLQSKRHSKRPILPLPASLGGALTLEDTFMRNSNRRHVPPLPSKNNSLLERTSTYPDEELSKVSSLSDSGFNGLASFASSSGSSLKYGESPSISISGHSSSLSWSSWSDSGNSNGSNTSVQATAWGLVVVAAGLGGEIKIFQNFGLPVRPSRQSNLFKDNT